MSSSTQTLAARREQWSRLNNLYRDRIIEAVTNNGGTPRWVNDIRGLRTALGRHETNGHELGHDEEVISVEDALQPVFEYLEALVNTISNASQFQQIPKLILSSYLAILQSSTSIDKKADVLMATPVINLMHELCDSIPDLAQFNDRAIYRFSSVQHVLQDLTSDFLDCCVDACSYLGTAVTAAHLETMCRNMLERARERMARHLEQLKLAVDHDAREEETLIDSFIPASITARPVDADTRQDANVVFPLHTVKRGRNHAFVGRDDLLDKMRKITSRNSAHTRRDRAVASSPNICVLSGLGGMGKTQVALEYFYVTRDHDFDACFWVNADHEIGLTSSFASIADKLELLDIKSTDSNGQEVHGRAIDRGRTWLQDTERRWLLIFDNVAKIEELDRFMPTETHSGSTIIITTQLKSIPAYLSNCHLLRVEPLNNKMAARCIFRCLGREPLDGQEEQIACQLADHVGCMPLAMATIGGYIKRSGISLGQFFQEIQKKDTVWKLAGKIGEQHLYDKSLDVVFDTAFSGLSEADREVLNVLAFLDPGSVPEEIFKKAIRNDAHGIGPGFKHIKTESDLLETYYELLGRQLIGRETSTEVAYITVHRVVQWNVLRELSGSKDSRWNCFKQAFDMVASVLPSGNLLQTPLQKSQNWPVFVKHGRQIVELHAHCLWPEPPVQLPLDFAQILTEMGTYMWFSGSFHEGEKALRTAQNICRDQGVQRGNQLYTAVQSMLGIITSYEGVSQRNVSMQFRMEALQSRKLDIGAKPEEERTKDEANMYWQMYSDLAFAKAQEEDFEEMGKLIEMCHEQYQKWETEQSRIPFEYAKYYWLMAFKQLADGQPVEAVKSITRCLELMQMKHAAGPEHPMTLVVKFCNAIILWHTNSDHGRAKALEIHLSVLAWRQKLLGEFSQFTLESYSVCGKLCFEAGEVNKARHFLEICTERRKRAVWNEEGFARASFRYAKVLKALADEAEVQGRQQDEAKLREQVAELSNEVTEVITRCRREHRQYMPETEDEEANLDQMVSLWAGRFTGRLKQRKFALEKRSSAKSSS